MVGVCFLICAFSCYSSYAAKKSDVKYFISFCHFVKALLACEMMFKEIKKSLDMPVESSLNQILNAANVSPIM